MIQQDTIKLLRECDAGIRMGTASIDQVLPHTKSTAFRQQLTACKDAHLELQTQVQDMLDAFQDRGKDLSPVAKGMAWVKTNAKLGLEESDQTVADLIVDGCNMGVKSLNRYLNQYEAASERTKDIAKRLIHLEERLASDAQAYL